MNLRFSPKSVRFRVPQEEFERLRAERVLQASTRLPGGGALAYEVRVSGAEFRLEWKECRMTLYVPEAGLNRIAMSPLKKDSGMEFAISLEDGNVLRVSFEIDLFKLRRR
ncbi:MAG: hypothetical protein HYW49_06640 [Deltaproteobacteria bacterium]|nr:hypothetical protein [Deltaproteobacteria bacterium]